MSVPPQRAEPSRPPARGAILLAGGLIVLAILAAYHASFAGPFVFDDIPAISENTSIRHLWPLGPVLSPPHETGVTVSGRPVVNLSFALNYAMGGLSVGGYHAVNLLIHACAALVLFGVVRRTLLQPALRGRFGADALLPGLAVALLWAVHPLLTGSVSYVVQRAESLMGLFYLLTLYGFIRATEAGAARGWWMLSIVACWLGMATKEVMVTAPVLVLLYDRTFVAGTVRSALTARWRYYAGLAASWLLLAGLVMSTGSRGGTVGFGSELTAWSYALVQGWAVVHYLVLTFLPQQLVFDYGTDLRKDFADVLLPLVVLASLAVAAILGWRRWPASAFAGLWFFLILAPTSSVVPVASQLAAEHRMYLPLAAVVAVLVLGGFAWLGRSALAACAVLALVAGVLTEQRTRDYTSGLALWSDTVAKLPGNSRAHYNLGLALAKEGRMAEAMAQYEAVLRIHPGDYEVQAAAGGHARILDSAYLKTRFVENSSMTPSVFLVDVEIPVLN